jgi:hypothetical protein
MKIVIAIANLIVLFLCLRLLWKQNNEPLKKLFWPSALFKCLAGLALGIVYTWYYSTGDTFQYFEDGKILADIARNTPRDYAHFLLNHNESAFLSKLSYADARALFFVKFVSLICLITADNYWIASLYCSIFSFLGAWTLVKSVHRYMSSYSLPAIIAFLFMPSVVFWTSGLIKESLACASLFFLSALFIHVWFGARVPIWKSLLALLALWLLWALKYYYAAVFVPVAFTFLLYKFWFVHLVKPKTVIAQVFLLLFLFIFPLLLFSFTHANFYYQVFLEVIVSNSQVYSQYSAPNDIIHYYNLKPEVLSVLLNSPIALFSGLFRPFISEAGNLVQAIAALENLIILGLTIWCLMRMQKMSVGPHFTLMLAAALYIILLCIFLTLSTPNFGTLSRYRVGYLPYFVLLLLSEERMRAILQRLFARLFGW